MDEEEKTELDEELDELETEDSDNSEETADDSDEFEYDDDGNIIIPETIDDDQEDNEEETDDEGESSDDEENEGSEESEADAEPTPAESEKDREYAELKAKYAALEAQGKETLAKLGVKSDSVIEGFEKVAAESDDISLEEYRKKKAESQRNDEAIKLLQRTEFEKKMKADLAEVQREYPETKDLKSITEIENFAEFGRLRDLGLNPKQAYAAANPDGVKKSVAAAVKQQSINDTKSHLKSAVPKGSKDNSITMSKKELAEWRDLFPNKTDKEIVALYKASLKK